jgi:hypothetical protein
MIQGWEDGNLGRNKVEHICVRKRTWDFHLGREQRLPVLATESMFNRYFQPSPSWDATFSLHMITRANNLCLLAGAAEQRFFPRPYRRKHQRIDSGILTRFIFHHLPSLVHPSLPLFIYPSVAVSSGQAGSGRFSARSISPYLPDGLDRIS